METIAEQQIQSHERQRSFDPLASVNRMRHDLTRYGHVLAETLEQICNEETSYLAEGAGRASRTDFALKREGDDLVYFDRGQWRPYMGMLLTGREVARREAAADPRKQFLADKAETDLYMGLQMRKLKPGQVLSWYSPYPYDIETRYGAAFLDGEGFISSRKMGFLYRAVCQMDGSVLLESQTVDRSDDSAFVAALSPEMQQAGMDAMVDAYDQALARKLGGQFYAGRRDSEHGENAWESIIAQRDLIEYFLTRLEAIARSDTDGGELETAVKKHIYGTWAAFKNRLDGHAATYESRSVYGAYMPTPQWIEQEVQNAFRQFASEGRVLIGCGGSISALQGEDNILSASGRDVFDAIFGGTTEQASGSEKLIWKKGVCVIDNCPTRPGQTEVAQCSVCRTCQSWYDKGRDPKKLYKGLKQAQKEAVTIDFDSTKQTRIGNGTKEISKAKSEQFALAA